MNFKAVDDGNVFMIKSANVESYFEPYDPDHCGDPEPKSLWVEQNTGEIWRFHYSLKDIFRVESPKEKMVSISPVHFYENFKPLKSSMPTPEPEESERSQSFGSW